MESPRRQRRKRKGPVPIGCSELFNEDFCDTMTADPNANDCSNPPERRLSSNLNVKGSTTSTARMARRRDLFGFQESGAKTRSKENFAAAASNAVPSWKRTPLFR